MLQSVEKISVFPPIYQIRKFVTTIWEHPLVDETTRKHRQLAVKKLTSYLQENGIDPKTFFTIPVGSLVWNTDSDSDFDYLLIVDNDDNLNKIEKIVGGEENKTRLKKAKIEIMKNYPDTAESYIDAPYICFSLFFTPDEYIGGNVEMARKTRLEAIKRFTDIGGTEETWDFHMNLDFDSFFRHWEETTVRDKILFKTEKESRHERIRYKLEERANQTHNPKSYREVFLRNREYIKIPHLNDYQNAIISSKGMLNLSLRHIAKGISI
ncbi:hypothetical protein M1328_02040 [Patescibacteria group bacterium]|nr:hypothetical protein [Patescibacteria group bacterium]